VRRLRRGRRDHRQKLQRANATGRDSGGLGRRRWVRGVVKFSHVFLQVEVPAEPFAADVTRERFLVVVRVHVKRQIVHLFGMKKQSTVILPEEVVTGFGWVASSLEDGRRSLMFALIAAGENYDSERVEYPTS